MSEQTFGRYHLRELLGKGGMATVHLAFDPRFEREVAIKVLPRHFLHDDSFQIRFQQEARTIAALEHPAIVPVHDFGEENGQPYLVMRYMVGGTLTGRLQDGPLPFKTAREIVVRLAAALQEAHQRGIIHRDLKPDNILFDQLGNPYLSDFGIAKLAAQTQTLTQGIIGTPQYMSPEQWRAKEALDGRCDQYALGIILYQMLTGDLPFYAQETTGYMLAHVNDPVPDIEQKMPVSPPGIGPFVQKTLAKRRENRFPSLVEWTVALQKIGQTAGPIDLAPMPDHSAATAAMLAPETIVESPLETVNPRPHKKTPRWGWAGGAAVVAIALVAWLLLRPLGENGVELATTASPAALVSEGAVAAITSPEPAVTETEPPPIQEEAAPAPTAISSPTAEPTERPSFVPQSVLGINWIEIPAGSFMMGAAPEDVWAAATERPLHEVELPTYWISGQEITNAQYLDFVQATGHPVPFRSRADFPWLDDETFEETVEPYLAESNWNPKTETFPSGKADHPVTVVSWADAQAFVEWLSDETGHIVLLPSEAEWEKAARGNGDPLVYPWGDAFEGGRLNYCDTNCRELIRDEAVNDGYVVTAPVDFYPSGISPYGVESMAGNVQEWTRSAFTDRYPYSASNEVTDPDNPAVRVVRGGSWLNDFTGVRISGRLGVEPSVRDGATGFRVVVHAP